jgi:hypothetical protein
MRYRIVTADVDGWFQAQVKQGLFSKWESIKTLNDFKTPVSYSNLNGAREVVLAHQRERQTRSVKQVGTKQVVVETWNGVPRKINEPAWHNPHNSYYDKTGQPAPIPRPSKPIK